MGRVPAMSKRCVVIGGWLLLSAAPAVAQEAKVSASLSSETGAEAEATSDGAKAPDASQSNDEFGHVLELGVFTGALFPSPRHALYSYEPQREYRPATRYELGGRAGIYPADWFGLEAEFMHARGAVSRADDTGDQLPRADFNAYRGHLLFAIPHRSVEPFILVGGGLFQVMSRPLGPEFAPAGHGGLGIKVRVSRDLAIRIEGRENVTERDNDVYSGLAFHEEVQIGLSGLLGIPAAPPSKPPPADRDHDNVPDSRDACPDDPALTKDGCPLDSDDDGVLDRDDFCPREAGEQPNGCPDLDKDKDGVDLPCDRCPDEAGVEPDGCPVRDTDGDGFLDDVDKCPKEPETKNGYEDDDGCPDEVPKEVEQFTGTIEGILFQVGNAKIQAKSSATLGKAAAVLNKYPSIRIEISGHTSSEGDPDFNQKLSEDRAAAVRDWLVNAGVESDRITTRGAGFSEPVADNNTRAGRQKNRRIEFKLLTR